eukprot:TRINITY_DN16_c0_g3_i1.p1 TRINITY_DN16_c0_g3~~TRINITY_DN16_c0_g3_i1.p1  ORF type:complete len:260 (+),score=84.02 TRINITY_DN16_c0_g3_i1:196-975(+)
MTIVEKNNGDIAEELQAVETKLQPHKIQVLFAHSVLTGQRLPHFAALILLTWYGFYWFHRTPLTVVQVVGLLTLIYTFLTVAYAIVDSKITNLDQFFAPLPGNKDARPLGTVAAYIVHVQQFWAGFTGACCCTSAANPVATKAKFVAYGLVAYYIGGWVSGSTLVFLIVNAILLTPFIVHNDYHVQALAVAKPHLQKADDVVGTKVRMVLEKVNGLIASRMPAKPAAAAPAAAAASSDDEKTKSERSTPDDYEKVDKED